MVHKSFNQTLSAKEVKEVSVTGISSPPDNVKVSAKNIPVAAESDLDNMITGAAPASPSGLTVTD